MKSGWAESQHMLAIGRLNVPSSSDEYFAMGVIHKPADAGQEVGGKGKMLAGNADSCIWLSLIDSVSLKLFQIHIICI